MSLQPGNVYHRLLLAFVCIGWSIQASAVDVILDVLEVSGRSQEEVAALIGQPADCDDTYQGVSCRYGATVEVIFIGGRADWIQVTPPEEISFEPTALRYIGLLPTLPLVRNPFRMHWDRHQGLAVVSLYGSGRYVALFQVRAFTPQ